eukprot:GILI01016617.1.p1 GENE.GILI01016617.1~~GILI01016617.1.p1  ORF type:complete len:499 (+),score=82.74 GILI01016617.1:53-1498(+)
MSDTPAVPDTTLSEKPEPTLEELHMANIASAQALLEVIERVKARQEQWQVVLAAALAKDRAEELECERAFRRVALHQMQTIAQGSSGGTEEGEFESWLNRKGTSIGSSKVQRWFHDDLLIRSTPYCAVVPLPANLSAEGEKELVAEVAAMGLPSEFYVENFPFQNLTLMQIATALGILGKSAAQSQGDVLIKSEEEVTSNVDALNASYLQAPCRGGEDILALVKSSEVLKMATKSTACLLLNDVGGAAGSVTALRRLGIVSEPQAAHTALLRCIVIGGFLVAVEGVPSSYHQKSGEKPFDTLRFAEQLSDFVRSLTDAPSSCLFRRSIQLMVSAHVSGGSEGANTSFYLLDVCLFEGANTDHFQLDELLLVAEYKAALRVKNDEHGSDAGRLLVRMAGSPWPEVKAIITRRSEPIATPLALSTAAAEVNASVDLPGSPNASASTTRDKASSISLQTVSILMVASAAVATAATVAMSALRKR